MPNSRLSVFIEIWYNKSPQVPSTDVADIITANLQNLWGGGWAGVDAPRLPWSLNYFKPPGDTRLINDDEREYVGAQFKHTSLRDNDTENVKLSAIQDLCKHLLGTELKNSVRVPDIGRGEIHWKPLGRGDLSWADRRFGIAFCLRMLLRMDHQGEGIAVGHFNPDDNNTGNQAILSQGQLNSIVSMTDILAWFSSQMEHIQAMLPPTNDNTDNTMRSEGILFQCLRFGAQVNEWENMAKSVAEAKPRKVQQEMLGKEVSIPERSLIDKGLGFLDQLAGGESRTRKIEQEMLEKEFNTTEGSLKDKAKEALGFLDELTSGVIEIRSPEDVGEATQALVELRKHALSAYQASNNLTNCKKTRTMNWVCGSGVFAVATAVLVFYSCPIIYPVATAAGSVRSGSWGWDWWGKYCKSKQVTKSIFDVGSVSHQIWLFMILYLMRLNGEIGENTEGFVRFAREMSDTFRGVNVIQNWGDEEYVKRWLREQRGLIGMNLQNVHRT